MTTNDNAFPGVPQEKFDKMDEAIKKSITPTQVKNLKVNYIDIENFKNIDGISTELSDINIIGGYNGNGKSSFVEAILTAIQSNKFYGRGAVSAASLIKKGENNATIRLLLKGEEAEIVVTRIFKKGTKTKPEGKTDLEATMNGEKISQASLDELLNSMTLDPLSISNLSDSEQIKLIKDTIGLDTAEIDKAIESLVEDRKESKKFRDQRKGIYTDITAAGVPENVERADPEKLLKAQSAYSKLDQKKGDMARKREELESIKSQIAALEERKNSVLESGKALNNEIKAEEDALNKEYTSPGNIQEQIHQVTEINEKAAKYQKYLEEKKSYNDAEDQVEKDEDQLSKARSKRTEIIAGSNLPEYMEIDETFGIKVDGQPYKLLNTARKIEVAIDLVMISGSPLRMIRIEQGGELDVKTLEAIKPKILENNFQIFLERPVIDKYDSIIISDGELIEEKEDFISKQ